MNVQMKPIVDIVRKIFIPIQTLHSAPNFTAYQKVSAINGIINVRNVIFISNALLANKDTYQKGVDVQNKSLKI